MGSLLGFDRWASTRWWQPIVTMEDPKAPLVGTEMVALEDKVPPTKAAPILEKQPPAHRCRKIVGAFVVVAAIVSGLGLILASKSTSGSASAPSPTRAPSLAPVALVACSLSLGGDATADELDDDASRAVITSAIAATLDVDEASIVNLAIADARRRRRLLAVVATFDVLVVASEGDATEALLEEAVASGDLTATIQATAVEEGVAVLEEATADAVAVGGRRGPPLDPLLQDDLHAGPQGALRQPAGGEPDLLRRRAHRRERGAGEPPGRGVHAAALGPRELRQPRAPGERDLRLRRHDKQTRLERDRSLVLGASQRPVASRDVDDAKPEMFATRNRRCSRRETGDVRVARNRRCSRRAKPEMFATRNRRAR